MHTKQFMRTIAALLFVAPLLFASDNTGGGTVAGNGNTNGGAKKVRPCENKSNGDVTVTVQCGSNVGSASMTPGSGANDLTSTAVNTQNGWKGTISGMEAGDSANVSNGGFGSVTGTGGSVSMGTNCNLVVNNNATTGGNVMTVTMPGGATISIPPGSSVQIVN